MEKTNPNSQKLIKLQEDYKEIQHSRVSWRRKSSYRKSIKRRVSKIRRLGNIKLIQLYLENQGEFV